MTDPINQEHEDVLNFAHSLPSGLTQEQIYVRIHERARAIPPAAAAAGLPADKAKLRSVMFAAYGRVRDDDRLTPNQIADTLLSAALPADPVDESQPADERAKFDAWWSEFTDEHDDWCYADSSALRWAAFKAGAALSAPVAPVTPKAIEEITDILLWPVTEDDARTARDMLQSIHFDLSMAENVAPVPAAQEGQGWTKNTGARPVADGVLVQVEVRDGPTMRRDAGRLDWSIEGGHGDIVRWRLAPAMEAQSHE